MVSNAGSRRLRHGLRRTAIATMHAARRSRCGNTFSMFNFEIDKAGLTFESEGVAGPAEMLAFGVLLMKDPNAPNGEQFLRDIKINFSVDPNNGTAEETTTHSFGMTMLPGDYRLA